MKKFFIILFLLIILNGCDDGYDMKKYEIIKKMVNYLTLCMNGLDYVSRYCRANNDGRITCR